MSFGESGGLVSACAGLWRSALRRSDAPAIIAGDEVLTYRRVAIAVAQFASALEDEGVGPGTVLGVCHEDRRIALLLLLAAEVLGAASVSLGPKNLTASYGPYRLCTRLAMNATAGVSADRRVIDVTPRWSNAALNRQIPRERVAAISRERPDDSIVRYISTSGTTGERKVMPVTASQQRRFIKARLDRSWSRLSGLPRFLLGYDFTAESAYRSAQACLSCGGAIIVSAGAAHFEAARRHAANVTWLLPSDAPIWLGELPPDFTRPQELRVITGGSMVPESLRHRLLDRVATEVLDLYSSNETAEIAWRHDSGYFHVYSDVGVEIVDEAGLGQAAGAEGVVAVRSDSLVSGYLGVPDATAQSFRDGWFISSDLGRMPSPGQLQLLGRRDDMLNLGGSKTSPYPMEARLRPIAGIRDVICVAAQTGSQDEVTLCVAIDVAPGVDREALVERVSSILQYPGQWHCRLVDALPLTAAGKPDRRAVQRLFERQTDKA